MLAVLPPASGAELSDTDRDGLTDSVEGALGTNALVADSRSTIRAAGLSVAGVTAAAVIASGEAGKPFSAALAASGGTGPYAFALTAGALPAGLLLNGATGAISGTPTTSGEFAFDYRVTDSLGASSVAIGSIHIAAAPTAQVPATPFWALLVLAGALLGIAVSRRRVRY